MNAAKELLEADITIEDESSKAVSSRSSSSGTGSPAAETPASSISTPVGYLCS